MWPFKRKLSWETEYAQNIYNGLVVHNEFGDITALKLRIRTADHQAYQNKILLQREMICFVALLELSMTDTELQPVARAFGDLVVSKTIERGLQMNRN